MQAPRYPFFLPCLAAGTSSPLPSSLTPGQLLQRSLRSTSSHSLFTFPYPSHTSALPSLFLHIPSLFPRLPHGTPHSLTMPAPPPQSLPCSPRSCPRSNSSLAFVASSQVYKCWEVLHLLLFVGLSGRYYCCHRCWWLWQRRLCKQHSITTEAANTSTQAKQVDTKLTTCIEIAGSSTNKSGRVLHHSR